MIDTSAQTLVFPLISVIIPAYNAEDFLERTLISVLNQTYPYIEVLVIDDGSTDRTPEIVEKIAQFDRRVKLFKQANAGVAAARNLGIQKARGELIAPIDADDFWYPENLQKQVQCLMQSDPSVGVVYSWSVYVDETDAPIGGFRAFSIEGDVFLTLFCHNFLGNASASLIRRACLEKVGYYSTEFRKLNAQGCEDWDLYLRIAEHYQFRVVPEFLVGYRKLSNSMSRNGTAMAKSCRLMLEAAQRRHPQTSDFLYRFSLSNFFIYLAYESDRAGDGKDCLLWIRRAFSCHPMLPLLRPNLYRLVLKNFWKSRFKSETPVVQPNHIAALTQKPTSAAHPDPMPGVQKNKQWIKVQLMVLIGTLFHRLVPVMAEFSKIQPRQADDYLPADHAVEQSKKVA